MLPGSIPNPFHDFMKWIRILPYRTGEPEPHVFGPLNAEPLEKKCGPVSRARPQSQYIRNYSFKENKDDYFSIKIRIQLSPEHLSQYNQPPLNTHPDNPEIAQNPSTFSMWFCCSLRSWSKMSCWSTGSSLKLAKCFPKIYF